MPAHRGLNKDVMDRLIAGFHFWGLGSLLEAMIQGSDAHRRESATTEQISVLKVRCATRSVRSNLKIGGG